MSIDTLTLGGPALQRMRQRMIADLEQFLTRAGVVVGYDTKPSDGTPDPAAEKPAPQQGEPASTSEERC